MVNPARASNFSRSALRFTNSAFAFTRCESVSTLSTPTLDESLTRCTSSSVPIASCLAASMRLRWSPPPAARVISTASASRAATAAAHDAVAQFVIVLLQRIEPRSELAKRRFDAAFQRVQCRDLPLLQSEILPFAEEVFRRVELLDVALR